MKPERKVGEEFEENGKLLKCALATDSCKGCGYDRGVAECRSSRCRSDERSDGKGVIFIRVSIGVLAKQIVTAVLNWEDENNTVEVIESKVEELLNEYLK